MPTSNRSAHTSDGRGPPSFWGRVTVPALATFALAACNPLSSTRGNGQLETVTRALVGDGGEPDGDGGTPGSDGGASSSDGSASPATVLLESVLGTTGMMPWSKLGSSLAVSGDVMVVSSPRATVDGRTNAGAAYVFHRDPATHRWVQAKQLVPHDTSSFSAFGEPLAVDGDTIAAVLPSLRAWNGVLTREAGVYLFGRNVGGPDQWGVVVKLTDPVDLAGGTFASSVALAGDLLFVGAVSATVDGMVMIFERNRGGADHWGKIATIFENDLGAAKGTDEAFGSSLAVDGDNLLIGGPPDRGADEAGDFFWNDNNGAAYLFSRDPVNRDQWSYVARLESPSPDGVLSDKFGRRLTGLSIKGSTHAAVLRAS